jgi:CHAT domain-containing protein/tetratricopeptide (TPR) repeat protein
MTPFKHGKNQDDPLRESSVQWIYIAMPRARRNFLETHTELLAPATEQFLQEILTSETLETDEKTYFRALLRILRDAQMRGGTPEAVRAAYVNKESGFILDLPPWLEKIEQLIESTKNFNQNLQTIAGASRHQYTIGWTIAGVRQAIARVKDDSHLAPEIYAALQYEFGIVLKSAQFNRVNNLDAAITALEAALQIYTFANYPIQYARTNYALGLTLVQYNKEKKPQDRQKTIRCLEKAIHCLTEALPIYTREEFPEIWAAVQYELAEIYQSYRLLDNQSEHQEKAINHFEATLAVYTPDTHPLDYAQTQMDLGNAYATRQADNQQDNYEQAISHYEAALRTLHPLTSGWAIVHLNLSVAYRNRLAGDRRENIKQAIYCSEEALQVFTRQAFPTEWAQAHNNLGRAYTLRPEGEQRANLEQAIVFFQTALKVFTRRKFPYDWAKVQLNLSTVYSERIAGEKRENIEQAIQHAEAALQVFTQQAFPVQWALMQNNLGSAYMVRVQGDRRTNLEQAIACHNTALEVYRREAFPDDWAMVQMNLSNNYRERLAGERSENIEQAIQHAEAALQVFTQQAFPVQWAQAHNNLSSAYMMRLVGERRINIEQAIASYETTLEIFTYEEFPNDWAMVQLNLGNAYRSRLAGKKSSNQEKAIRSCEAALQVYSQEVHPQRWAMIQNNLGGIFLLRPQGERRKNMEQSLAHFQAALQVYTFQSFPFEWAKLQVNLVIAYMSRLEGEAYENQERAIYAGKAALRFYTQKQYPVEWAMILYTLAEVYMDTKVGESATNLANAADYCTQALQVYTLKAFPIEHRQVQFCLAQVESQRQNWQAVHTACEQISAVTEFLVQLGAGTSGRMIALEGESNAVALDAFALVKMGRIGDALLTLERGRARGLARALALNEAVPDLIRDSERRKRYIAARNALGNIQHMLDNTFLPIDQEQRRSGLEGGLAYQQAREDFDRVVAEIRAAHDPDDFLQDTMDSETLLRATEIANTSHAVVYLTATPWGGLALAALGNHASLPAKTSFAFLDLPKLTYSMIQDLAYTFLENDPSYIAGGLASAQHGNIALPKLPDALDMTWREVTMQFHTTVTQAGNAGKLAEAMQAVLNNEAFKPFVDQPIGMIDPTELAHLKTTMAQIFLQLELQRSLEELAHTAMRPLIAWLQKLGTTSLTLIPCGSLAIFPLASVPIDKQLTVADWFPTSIAPNARSLLHRNGDNSNPRRAGVYSIGNPLPTNVSLEWSEAEALTVTRIARKLGMSAEARIQNRATREWLIEKLAQAAVIDASCHGRFRLDDFLQSALVLANRKELTLADMLHNQADLHGLRLLVLSACQTAIPDLQGIVNQIYSLQGVIDEVHSLAVGMLQAGAKAVLASLWVVDDRATYLLIARFFQEWLPQMDVEPPAAALARAQAWLRTITNRELAHWQTDAFPLIHQNENGRKDPTVTVRGENTRYDIELAGRILRSSAQLRSGPDARPYEDPIYWAGFQVNGW